MKTMIQCIVLFLFVFSLAGCGAAPASGPITLAAETLLPGFPDTLGGAHLLYEREGGIFYAIPGKGPAVKVVDQGSWPRWFPAGDAFVFVRDDDLLVYTFSNNQERAVYRADEGGHKPLSPDVHPVSGEIWFIAGNQIKSVDIKNGQVGSRFSGNDFRELDISPDGTFAAVTVKRLAGYQVERIDLVDGSFRKIGRGCSASISGNGALITVNLAGHTRLAMHDSISGNPLKILESPNQLKLDNQKCSNHPDWMVGIAEDRERAVILQNTADGRAWQLVGESGCDRPDLLIR